MRIPGRFAGIGVLLAAAVAAAPHAAWAAANGGGGVWPPPPELVIHPEEITVPQDPLVQEGWRRGHAGLREFLRGRPGWRATVDPLTGSVDRAFGEGIELGGPAGEETGRSFLRRHRSLFADGLEGAGSELLFNEEASRPLSDPSARFLQFDLRKDGLEVLGAGLSLGVREDLVVLIASRALRPVTASSRPAQDIAAALESVRRHLAPGGGAPASLAVIREPSLAFHPRAEGLWGARVLRHHLVWVVAVKPQEAPFHEAYIAYVDAHDGRLLAFFPEARTVGACSADSGQARATVLGGVRANRGDDPETVVQLPFAQVSVDGTLVAADLNGRFPFGGGSASSPLRGDFFKMRCDNCVSPAQPLAAGDASGDVDFGTGGGSSGPPAFGNGRSTPADRTAFYHLQQARLLLGKWDNAVFDEIEAFVNIGAHCNAFSLSYMLGFYASGEGCRNTGEIRDVLYHELGHTWDRFDGNRINSGSLSEWKGDLLALAIGGDSCIAESFFFSGGPSPTCTGVREIDEKTANRGIISTSDNPCLGGIHCLGEIAGQATWHLLRNMLTGSDYHTGATLAAGNPALAAERARWLLERLTIAGGPPMQVLDPASAGVSIYDALMLIDDDDANLANGVPHAAYINPAFAHHGVAETPEVADAANCSSLSDPMATALVDRDPSTGLPLVRLEWTSVPGATSFDVYRNTWSGDGFLPLARGLSSGPFVDAGVQVGATYRYFVAAVRRTGCADVSPGGEIVTLTVAPPELKVLAAAASEAPGASDGDGRIEPGERVRVRVTLAETGGFAGATSVTASVTSRSPRSPVTAAGPIGFGSIAAGGSSMAASDFELFLGPSEACGGRPHVLLSASGNEGCWLDSFDIPISAAAAGCAPSPSAFVEVVPGSLQVLGGTGDGDEIPDNCEVTSARYQIRNSGSLASGPAASSVATAHPGVTFSPPPACSAGSLAGGASATCQFSFSLGGATPAGIPFTLTANSAGNPAPSVVEATLGAESDKTIFSTMTFGFEGSFQGWTAREFSLSSARASSGLQSARSGSTSINNLCGKLTSPAFLLHPAAASTLAFRMYADIEPASGDPLTYFDRANVHVVDVDTGSHTLVTPSSGPAYNASGNIEGALCHVTNELGWAENLGGFHLVTFDLSAFVGRRVRIEINYDTDEGDDREGIYIDEVTLTNAAAAAPPADPQGDACVVPEVSGAGAPAPLQVTRLPAGDLRFTWEDLGPGFQYNLYAGALGAYYSHGGAPVTCSGLGAGVTCDGAACAFVAPGPGLPPGALYFLATATGFGIEGTSGFSSGGPERDPAQNTCAP